MSNIYIETSHETYRHHGAVEGPFEDGVYDIEVKRRNYGWPDYWRPTEIEVRQKVGLFKELFMTKQIVPYNSEDSFRKHWTKEV